MSIQISADIIERAAKFKGNGHHLESALGAYTMAHLYGWRVVRLLHGTRIMQRHQRILGVKLADVCPERTNLADRCLGIRIADKVGAYWRVVEGTAAGRERFEMTDTQEAQGSLL